MPGATATDPRRITLVTDELLGYVRTGGIGTATSLLALALARMGHDVQILSVADGQTGPPAGEWPRLYEEAGVDVRPLARSNEAVAPPYFGRMRDVERTLAANPPDVVVVQDLAAPCYAALRLKQLGLGFPDTLFVVWCHGTRQWITDTARKVRVLPGALAISRLEQASVELADVIVSPSAYMVDWMRRQRWRLPHTTRVIPLLTRSGATGEPPPVPVRLDGVGRVERLAVFGRLEARKGLGPLAAGLNQLEPELLAGIELEFIGRATPAWPPHRVEGLLSERVRGALARVSFHTDLDRNEALARIERPGTLAIMPSLEDNSPNTVYECLERGIPFLASRAGGMSELVSQDDRRRVLFEPTAQGVESALRRALSAEDGLPPARPAFDDGESLRRWDEVIAMRPQATAHAASSPAVDAIVVYRSTGPELQSRCTSALARQSYVAQRVLVADARASSVEAARGGALGDAEADWVVFLDETDLPEPKLLETLVRAQTASRADVVTCGLFLTGNGQGHAQHYFAGEPGALGLLSNGYGTVALLRRSLLDDLAGAWPTVGDPDWPLLARLSASGARIVSVPLPLVTRATPPASLERHASDALLVAEHLERVLPDSLRSLARLTVGLAADAVHRSAVPPERPNARQFRRVTGRLR